MDTKPVMSKTFHDILLRLVNLSIEDYYNPYREFVWPEHIAEDQYWMSKDLMSIAGTPLVNELSEEEIMRLSKWESINFYSLNVHGIRELLIEVIKRIHTTGFELPSEFFHHFIGEENEHMWFFAQFCLNYGNKIYKDKKLKLDDLDNNDVQHFMVFARILIFEEIVDYFNMRMGNDESLHPTIRKINSLHHQDESRHIAFGREIVKMLHADLKETMSPDQLFKLSEYLKRYLVASVQSLYNPEVYKDAGIPEPYKFRNTLVRNPQRRSYHEKVLKRTVNFFINNQIIDSGELPYDYDTK